MENLNGCWKMENLIEGWKMENLNGCWKMENLIEGWKMFVW